MENLWRASEVEQAKVADLLTPDGNARTHGERQLRLLRTSIEANGFVVPLVVDPDGFVISGAGRLEVARRMGMEEVPIVRASHLTLPQSRAFALLDNRLSELGDWDDELLAKALADLEDADTGMDELFASFAADLMGDDEPDDDDVFAKFAENGEFVDEDEPPPPLEKRIVYFYTCPHCGHEDRTHDVELLA